jgi:CRISPR associated protein Cas1
MLGFMHYDRDSASAFVFDLMEPERPKVDRAVLDFVKGQVFDSADFVICADGVCRLNPEWRVWSWRGCRHRRPEGNELFHVRIGYRLALRAKLELP